MLQTRPALRTCSYWRQPPGFTTVRTSLGTPRGIPSMPALLQAAPPRSIWDADDFADLYRDVLDHRTVSVLDALERLLAEHGPLALACFEHDPGTLDQPRCHRIVLAYWLTGHGYTVEEIA